MGQIYPGPFTHYCVCEILDPRAWVKYILAHSPIIVHVKFWNPELGPNIPWAINPSLSMLNFGPPELGPNIPWVIHPSLSMSNFGPPELWPNIPWAIHPLLFMLNFRSHGLGQIYTGPFTQYCLCQTLEHRYCVKYTLRHSHIFVYAKHWNLELGPIIPWAFIHYCLC